ncbi:putative Zeta toxin-domain-containing protein [Seiridium cardinale]|uniref:Zeta toxin-domain-containing protein n=1 Tax=Seiridium cardinale TaxID=138064 RepID=A0ABR2XZ26_9PEZI
MAPITSDLSAYVLSESESHRIFIHEIVPEELGDLDASESPPVSGNPLAVLVVGQTGAGKTRIAPALKEVMRARRSEPAHFIADTYKTYHPAYSRLIAEKPALASPATGADARRWLSLAAAYAIERRTDVLAESACRHPQDFAELAQAFHGGGYRVEVVILAVPEAISRLGILTRFYERLPEAGSRNLPIRLTPRKVHDDSYRGLVDAAAFLDESSAVDQVVIVRRNNMVAFANERVNGAWKEPARVTDSLLFERRRPLLERERLLAKEALKKLRARNEPGLAPQLQEIAALLEFAADGGDGGQLRPLILPSIEADTSGQDGPEPDLRLGLDLP